ncbi:hypothetical protein ATC00_09745 [Sinorhizobium americanum]|nr:hypothetical protein ATC00_09745 [Sinorhizobium americanum]
MLIFQTFNKLFDNEIDSTWHHVRLDKLDVRARNVIIGPGGLLSGAYKPEVAPDELVIRHLTPIRLAAWKKQARPVFAFGTGTNTPFENGPTSKPFSAESGKTIAKLAQVSDGLYLRGSADIRRLAALCATEDLHKFKFQPCPSVFLDRLFSVRPQVSDQIAINFPLEKSLTADNAKTHPLNRFVEFAKALGLSVALLDNHPSDINKIALDLFAPPQSDAGQSDFVADTAKEDGQKLFEQRWTSVPFVASRFNGYRFAFGVRLHSFLPFMAFNTPSVFLAGNPIRMPMPIEYFGNPAFGAKVAFGQANFGQVVDGMIERLKYFVKNEDRLRMEIADQRARLWEITQKNKAEVLSRMN